MNRTVFVALIAMACLSLALSGCAAKERTIIPPDSSSVLAYLVSEPLKSGDITLIPEEDQIEDLVLDIAAPTASDDTGVTDISFKVLEGDDEFKVAGTLIYKVIGGKVECTIFEMGSITQL